MNRLKQFLLRFKVMRIIRDLLIYIMTYNKSHEIRHSYGRKNPDKTFYVIRNYTKEAGWGSILNYVCLHIEIALNRGLIPVVDMQNYENIYLESQNLHKENAWEYYFKPLSGYSLKEVYSSKSVILCGNEPANLGYKCLEGNRYSEIIRDYVIPNEQLKDAIDREISRVTENESKRVLGIVCRGTDYVYLRPAFHGIPLSAEKSLELVNQYSDQYDAIYLATEDDSILEYFISNKGSLKLFYSDQRRFKTDKINGYLYDVVNNSKEEKKALGYDYLRIIYTLAACTSLITPPCGAGIMAACINNGQYEMLRVENDGLYSG